MVTLNINGHDHSVDVPNDTPLLWVIREHLQMTGTKFGCGAGLCGACTVHLNGGGGALLPDRGIAGLWQKNHHHRRSGSKGRASAAARLDRRAGSAMRLLPVRADHASRITPCQEHRSNQSRDRCAHGRQSLPLHDLRTNPARHYARGCRHAGSLSHDKTSEDQGNAKP
jgi:ferredoxin